MPWLAVLGEGSWSYVSGRVWEDDPGRQPPGDAPRDEHNLPKRGRWLYDSQHFGPGIHEVSEEVAQAALREKLTHVIVSAEEPKLKHPDLTGPLTRDDLFRGSVQTGLALPDEEVPLAVEDDPEAPPLVHSCAWCPRKFPSEGSLKRHVEFEHTVRHEEIVQTEEERAAAEAEAKAEQQRVEAANPKHLHPAEREILGPVAPVDEENPPVVLDPTQGISFPE